MGLWLMLMLASLGVSVAADAEEARESGKPPFAKSSSDTIRKSAHVGILFQTWTLCGWSMLLPTLRAGKGC